jgi:DNA polymerase III delta subunit
MEGAGMAFHFRRRDAVERALARWSSSKLLEAANRLAEATAVGRRMAAVAEAASERALLGIAIEGARLGR